MQGQDERHSRQPSPARPSHRHPRHRAGRRAGGVLWADAGGLWAPTSSRWSRPAAAPRAVSAPSTRTVEDPERSLFFWQYNRGKRSIVLDLRPGGRPRAVPRARRHRRRAAGVHAQGRARRARAGRGRADAAVSLADRRAGVPLRRPWALGRLQGLGPGAPRAGRRHDELRLRSGPRRQVRSAADRPPDVARLPHRRRAARRGHHRRAALSLADGEGPAPVVRDPRGGGEVHRGRPHVVGDAARPGAAPDLPSRAGNRLAAPVHRAHEGRALGDGQPGDAPR